MAASDSKKNSSTAKAAEVNTAAKVSDAAGAPDFTAASNFYNRELSWLGFNSRCLSEARDSKIVPLFERLKFLSITESNLDEFCMVRIASLKDQVHAGYKGVDIAGRAAEELSPQIL